MSPEQTAAQLRQLDATVTAMQGRIQELETTTPSDGNSGHEEEEPPETMFDTVEEFVNDFVRVRYEQPSIEGVTTMSTIWCRHWHDHPSVHLAFNVLWQHFEEARINDALDGGGSNLDNYLVNYFNPQLDRITGPTGPFRLCTAADQHVKPTPLGTTPTIDPTIRMAHL